MTVCVTTIVAANYLAYAKVLAASLGRYGTAPLRVLIVDRPTPEVRAAVRDSGLDCVYAQDLGLADFERIAYKYDILELSTALKPSFLKRMLAEGFERVVYLDPDIELHAPLQPVLAALDSAEIVLTPHALQPVMDGSVHRTSISCAPAASISVSSPCDVAPIRRHCSIGGSHDACRTALRIPGTARSWTRSGWIWRHRSSRRCTCCVMPAATSLTGTCTSGS